MSLVRTEDHAEDEPRFTMLETLREYGLEQLAAHGEPDTARQRHAAFFQALAEASDDALRGRDAPRWMQRIVAERDNLRAALEWQLTQPGDGEPALRLTGALYRFWWMYGTMGEGRLWLERAIARGQHAPDSPRAKALVGAGFLSHYLGDVRRAKELIEEGLALARRARDARQTVAGLNYAASIAIEEGDLGHARSMLEEGLALAREVGDAANLATLSINLGEVARREGDYAYAVRLYNESLHLYGRAGNQMGVVVAEMNLGFATLHQGELDRADGHFRESLDQCLQLGSDTAVGVLSVGFAAIAAAGGEYERAARLFGASAALLERAGFHLHPADSADRDHFLTVARAALGEAAFAAAWEAGRSMSEAETHAYALRSDESSAAEVPSSLIAPRSSLPDGLTPREVDVLRLIAAGRRRCKLSNWAAVDSGPQPKMSFQFTL